MKLLISALAVLGTVYVLPAVFPWLKNVAFHLGDFGVTWLLISVVAVLYGCFKL